MVFWIVKIQIYRKEGFVNYPEFHESDGTIKFKNVLDRF